MESNNAFRPTQGLPEIPLDKSVQPRVAQPLDNDPLFYSLPNLHYRFAEQIGKRGFSNGLLRIPKETYENYIAAYEENKRLGLLINNMEREAQAKEIKIKQTEQNRDQFQAIVIRKKQESSYSEQAKEKYAGLLQQIQDRYQKINEQFHNHPLPYGWIGTLLFIAGGIIFITTDFSIIRNIAGNALDLAPQEAITFALGVAFLAIVIKPLVDRFFEKPYQGGKTSRMHVFLIVIGLFTVLLLGLMGAYRKDTFIALKREMELKREIQTLEKERDDENDEMRSKIDLDLLEKKKELREVVAAYDSNLVLGIFLLSSILFAIAGAICFSIGVPVFRKHSNRVAEKSFLGVRAFSYKIRLRKTEKKWYQAENEWKIASQRLSLLPDLTILGAEFKRALLDIQIARAAQHEAHTAAVLAIYQDNYYRGERYIPSEEELAQFEVLLAEQNGIKQGNYQLSRKFSGSNLYNSQYLHEYIRQRINKENKQTNAKSENIYRSNGVKR